MTTHTAHATPTPAYWVLLPGGYPNAFDDYAPCADRAYATDVLREAAPYMGDPALHAFDGLRTPWLEHDAYPDYVLTVGARGGIKWERV